MKTKEQAQRLADEFQAAYPDKLLAEVVRGTGCCWRVKLLLVSKQLVAMIYSREDWRSYEEVWSEWLKREVES